MSQGSQHDPFLVEDEDVLDSIEGLDFLTLEESDNDELDVISIDDDDEPASNSTPTAQSSTPRRRSPQESLKNAHVQPPDVEIESYQLNKGILIEINDTVELKATEAHPDHQLHSGDFLRVKHIIRNLQTDEVKLLGYRLRRSKYVGQIFDWKLNELVMVLDVSEDDSGDPFIQGMIEVTIKDVSDKRDCVITNKPYPFCSFRDIPSPAYFNSMSEDEIKQSIYHQGRLACRWVIIQAKNKNGKSYSGLVRGIYSSEADYNKPPTSAEVDQPSRASSVTIGDEDGDIVMIEEPDLVQIRKIRPRSNSLEELDQAPRRRLNLPSKAKKYTFGDAFCGAGGASTGAAQAGLHIKWGLDFDHHAIQAHCFNHKDACPYLMDAHKFPPPDTPISALKVDVAHFSPPCCYWSPAHTINGKNDQANFEAIYTVGPILKKLKPRIATLEQTYGLMTNAQHAKNFKLLLNDVAAAGYDVRYKIVDMSDYGLPQRRKRLLIIAARRGTPLPPFPKPTHGPAGSGLKRYASVASALAPLARLGRHMTDKYHQPGGMHLLKKDQPPYNPENKMLSGCITASSGGENYHFSGLRKFTARELALLQSFPLDYVFTGTQTEAKKQIGNAFPPVMAQAIYESCAKTLEAFDHGLIGAEDDIEDLDAILELNGIGAPASAPNGASLLDTPTRGSASRPLFRYLSHTKTSFSSSRAPASASNTPKKSSLFGGGNDIEPEPPRSRKKQKTSSFFGLVDSDEDDDEGYGVVWSPKRSKKQKEMMTDEEKLFWAEANGEIIELEDSD